MNTIPTFLSVQSTLPQRGGGEQFWRLVKDGERLLVRARVVSLHLPGVSILKTACASEFGKRRQHRTIHRTRQLHLQNKQLRYCPASVSFMMLQTNSPPLSSRLFSYPFITITASKPICHVQLQTKRIFRLHHRRPK